MHYAVLSVLLYNINVSLFIFASIPSSSLWCLSFIALPDASRHSKSTAMSSGMSGKVLFFHFTVLLPLPLDVNQFLQHFIRCRNNAAVCLETPLGYYHFGELLGKVHVRHFQRAGIKHSRTVGTGF